MSAVHGMREHTMCDPDAHISPEEVLDHTDPGDDTQRRYRYQHGYGVILLIGAAADELPYEAIWCEHHDDFLAKRKDGFFESFQVKTAKPENGPWDTNRPGLRDAFGKFAKINEHFRDRMARFHFVSNVECLDTEDREKIRKSPVKLCKAIDLCKKVSDLAEPYAGTVGALAEACASTADGMFHALKKTALVKGPGLDTFETEIAHTHLPTLSHCQSLVAAELNAIRDEIIAFVFRASSLSVDDPSKHWRSVTGEDREDPRLLAKRITVPDVMEVICNKQPVPFRFAPFPAMLDLRAGRAQLTVLQKKFAKGGLAAWFDTMHRRALSAERHLLELSHTRPDEIEQLQNQLESVVSGVCHDAHLVASAAGEPFGAEMLRRVQEQLRQVADHSPAMVYKQPYECLTGVAGLLTEECRVWWSQKFELEEAV